MINRTTNNNETAAADSNHVHVGITLLRVGPVMVYLRFCTIIFTKFLLASHPNLAQRSATYQRLVKRLIFVSSLLLGMLIWIIETEFMGFFLKYVVVRELLELTQFVLLAYIPSLLQKISPKLWIFPPRIITESFVTLKLLALNSLISKYEAMASDTDSLAPAFLGFRALELSRIEDILAEFFENCELGRSGYLLINPIRMHTSTMLSQFQEFVDGRLYKMRDKTVTADDLEVLPPIPYRSLNAKRSHSVNCIDDFRKFVEHNKKLRLVDEEPAAADEDEPLRRRPPRFFELD